MINLYNKNTEDFKNNGIANLKDMISCIVTEELNGSYELEAEYPLLAHNANLIQNESILKVDVGTDKMQLFRIKRTVPNLQTIKINANHISYDLKDNNLLDVYPQKLSGAAALDWLFSKTQYSHKFITFSDITKTGTARYVNKNPIRALIGDDDNSFVKVWGGEIVRDNFTIKMLQKRGNDLGYKLSKTKNITGLEFDIDDSNIITRVIPKAYNGIKLPEIFIDSPIIDEYPHPIIQELDYSDIKLKDDNSEDGYDTLEEVYAALRKAVSNDFSTNNIDKPVISIKVNFVELSKTIEYKEFKNLEELHLGDYVNVSFENYNVKLRVIKTKFDSILKRYTELELGEAKSTFTDSISKKIDAVKNEITKVEIPSFLNQAKINATEQLNKALGGYVYKAQNELFIMDSDIPEQAIKVWRWNLNGLGYSRTGINGPYELAMTQDGQIVADFITTGKLKTAIIEGYDQLVTTVKELNKSQTDQDSHISQIIQDVKRIEQQISGEYGMTKEITGTDQIFIEDALKYYPLNFKIKGYSDMKNLLYPGNLYPGVGHVPLSYKENQLSQVTICVDSQDRNNPTEDLKEYPIIINEPLRSLGSVEDELEIYISSSGEIIGSITRYLKNTGSQIVKLDNPIFELITPVKIELLEHSNYIYIKEQPNYQLYVKYLIYSEMNEFYATKVELNSTIRQTEDSITAEVSKKYSTKEEIAEVKSSIKQTTDEISSEVSKKVGNDEIISAINQTAETIKILANKIGLTANDVLNIIAGNEINLTSRKISLKSDNCSIDKDGNAKFKNGEFEGKLTSNEGYVGGWKINENGLTNGTVTINKNGIINTYTPADLGVIMSHIMGSITLKGKTLAHYDFNGDGQVTAVDYVHLYNMIEDSF